MGRYGGKESRNHGYGRSMSYAGRQVLQARYGEGHFATVATHRDRWNAFADFCREHAGIRDMRDINSQTVREYASQLRDQGLAVSTIQNRISTVNVIVEHAREGDWERQSPRELAGESRSSVRVDAPLSIERDRADAALSALREQGLDRAAAIYHLAGEFGMRSEEACKANLDRFAAEAERYGAINIVDGTKGGRDVERWVPVSAQGREALNAALTARPESSRNLIAPTETYAQFRAAEVREGREILQEHGISGYHDARAGYACARYEELAGHAAPVVAGARLASREADGEAREIISRELGHGRVDVVAAYLGSAR